MGPLQNNDSNDNNDIINNSDNINNINTIIINNNCFAFALARPVRFEKLATSNLLTSVESLNRSVRF